ncbi:hypothetical protein EMCRGX_G012359 [Ephydatia muelleri]
MAEFNMARAEFPYRWFFIHDIEPSHVHRLAYTAGGLKRAPVRIAHGKQVRHVTVHDEQEKPSHNVMFLAAVLNLTNISKLPITKLSFMVMEESHSDASATLPLKGEGRRERVLGGGRGCVEEGEGEVRGKAIEGALRLLKPQSSGQVAHIWRGEALDFMSYILKLITTIAVVQQCSTRDK